MRFANWTAAAAMLAASASGAFAQAPDYTGKWLFSGLILSGRMAISFAQICNIQQTGAQIAGPCQGPNGGCSAVGIVNGGQVDLTCTLTTPNNPGLSGLLTFHGAVAPDAIVRGTVTHSRAGGVAGQAAMMRL